jgi:hypothetical protein
LIGNKPRPIYRTAASVGGAREEAARRSPSLVDMTAHSPFPRTRQGAKNGPGAPNDRRPRQARRAAVAQEEKRMTSRREFFVAAAATAGAAASTPALAQGGAKPVFDVPAVTIPIAGSSDVFPVRRIYCIGRNYAAHAIERGSDPNREPPFFFQKPTDAIQNVAIGQVADHSGLDQLRDRFLPQSFDVQRALRGEVFDGAL